MTQEHLVMGVDIGGTGIKAAVVDVVHGTVVSERIRIITPRPARPRPVYKVIRELQRRLGWQGAVGCGFPGLVKGGLVHRAPNLDPAWNGHDLVQDLQRWLGTEKVGVGNDADAAGLAEMKFGAGRGRGGTVVMVTLGTGIGCAMFREGVLIPDTELGHIEINGQDAEEGASNAARERHGWNWRKWGRKVDRYLERLQYYLGVDLFIVGGGACKKWDKFSSALTTVSVPVVPAHMENLAGIVGAALWIPQQAMQVSQEPAPNKPAP
ncbi:MAG TPA: ROK family protein [Candidatus Xenobia bacterium]|jgi:polyphosphate glucokinase